jgi:predicted ABC-type ATPase
MAQPALYIVAGPNGSGKTTFALNDPALNAIPFINADIEAERLSPGSPANAALAAGRTTLANIARQISQKDTFALETTLSGLSTLTTMRRAQTAGYTIDLSYLCLDSPDLNRTRVAMRVAAGGHDIPDEDIFRRFHRSLRNLPAAVALADRARVFDNTRGKTPRLIFELHGHQILHVHSSLPDWFNTAFQIGKSVAEVEGHITDRLQALRINPR